MSTGSSIREVGVNLVTSKLGSFEKKHEENYSSSMWAAHNGRYSGVQKSEDRLPNSIFACGQSDVGPFLRTITNETDDLIELPDSASEIVLNEIKEFITLESEFRKRNLIFKRGILLYGPPGSGKSCTVRLLINLVIEHLDGIALMIENPYEAVECLHLIRQIEPKRQIIAILEDIDTIIRKYDEHTLLALLDGEHQVDNIVYVATTNYPELLDDRFKDRPSRFDSIIMIDLPSDESRRAYLKAKEISLTGDELEKYVRASKGFTLSHLRELIILTQCFKKPFDESVKRVRQIMDQSISSADTAKRIKPGFYRD